MDWTVISRDLSELRGAGWVVLNDASPGGGGGGGRGERESGRERVTVCGCGCMCVWGEGGREGIWRG